tara:strand:- start:980 stop:1312 length:333 start_codon:yes stop_codon:yes gene_type:complete
LVGIVYLTSKTDLIYSAKIGKSHPRHSIVLTPVIKNRRLKVGKINVPSIVQRKTMAPSDSEYNRLGLARPAPGLAWSRKANTKAQRTPIPAKVGFIRIIVPNIRRDGFLV